jgi:hypothetical protein
VERHEPRQLWKLKRRLVDLNNEKEKGKKTRGKSREKVIVLILIVVLHQPAMTYASIGRRT